MAVTISGNGQIIKQVIQTVKSDTFSTTSASPTFVSVTGLSASITPTSSSNKILVMVTINIGQTDQQLTYIDLVRNGSAIFIGDSASNRPRISGMSYYAGSASIMQYACVPYSFIYLDSPSTTSATTYSVSIASGAGGTSYVNRTGADRDTTAYDGRTASSITVMEVAYS